MTTFRAAQVASPRGQLTLADRTLVDARPASVRVGAKACGICHSDSVFVDDLWPPLRSPVTPGREIAGRKEALGEGWRLWGRPHTNSALVAQTRSRIAVAGSAL